MRRASRRRLRAREAPRRALLLAVPQAAARAHRPLPVLRRDAVDPAASSRVGAAGSRIGPHGQDVSRTDWIACSHAMIPLHRRSNVMAFPGTGKIWMNGTLVDWADAKIHIASHVIHYGSGVFEGARCYSTPHGSACFRLDAHMRRLLDSAQDLPDGAAGRLRRADRRRARDDPRERVQGLLHPPAHLSRLQRARRQPVPLPGRRRHPDVGMGRLSRPGRARERRRRPRQLVDAHRRRTRSRRWRRPRRTTRTRS